MVPYDSKECTLYATCKNISYWREFKFYVVIYISPCLADPSYCVCYLQKYLQKIMYLAYSDCMIRFYTPENVVVDVICGLSADIIVVLIVFVPNFIN